MTRRQFLRSLAAGTASVLAAGAHGIAVDSRGDIYVAEVSRTLWRAMFGKEPDHELRCFQKLARMS